MTLKNFRTAATVLIIFNPIGTVVTWTAHLVKPGTANTYAILFGTEFTGPLLFIALWTVFVLMTLAALAFAVGEITEFFKSNVGLSSGKWNFVLAASAAGLVIAAITVILGIGYLVQSRKR